MAATKRPGLTTQPFALMSGGPLRRELQGLDGFEVLHAAADALCRVEEHVRLRAVGIAQHADADAVDDEIPAAEVSEGHRVAVGCERRHVLALDHRIAE